MVRKKIGEVRDMIVFGRVECGEDWISLCDRKPSEGFIIFMHLTLVIPFLSVTKQTDT